MAKWIKCILGEFVVFQRGYDLPKSQMQEGEYPVVGSNGIIGFHNDYTTDEPSITIGRSGNVGKPFIHYGKTWSHNTTLYIKDYKGNDPVFAFYYLKTLDLANYAGGSAVPTLNRNHIHTLPIYVLNSTEQQKHVGLFFKRLDEKIETNKKINDNLEKQIQTIYDYWFTQFEFPDSNSNPYKSSNGTFEWNSIVKRNIPINWSVGSVAKNTLTSFIKPGVDKFEFKTYLATADVKGSTISEGTIIDYDNRESRANMQPTEYSVWFAKMKNSIKHLYLNSEMQPIIEGSILSTGFCGLQCDETSFEYISSYISSPYFELHKDMLAHGATQEAVNNDDLAGIHLVIPDEETLKKYHNATKSLYSQIANNVCENKELIKLRDWLLPMLMNGQATICD